MTDSPKVSLPAVAILGTGSMGGAILTGLTAPGVEVEGGVRVTTRSSASAAALDQPGRVTAVALDDDADANRSAAAAARIVVLAVKPAGITALAAEIGPDLAPGTIVVSVAAGVSAAAIEERLPGGIAVVRAMPNTPATVGRGVTGLSAGSRAAESDLELVSRLFAPVGSVHVVPESQLDALTAISGSGPAYVFYLIEKLARSGVALGLDAALASALAAETFSGAAELLATSDVDAAELRRRVTSPGGTTERAIGVFDERGLEDILDAATEAARDRAAEIAAERR